MHNSKNKWIILLIRIFILNIKMQNFCDTMIWYSADVWLNIVKKNCIHLIELFNYISDV